MKRKRRIAKRKPKLASLPKKGTPIVESESTHDEWNLDDYNNDIKINGSAEIGGLKNLEVVDLTAEDSTSSSDGLNVAVSNSLSKKSRSEMNKSSDPFFPSSIKQISNAEKVQMEGPQLPNQDHEYKQEELKIALEVIRKVMKMDAAQPFNVPVDPVALGIPDYFDIIDTPMDFGTICCNIEYGVKYKNSKDVMRDVQYIWNNCCMYNRKGHYVLELMKRAKTKFIEHWTEAGLCNEEKQEIDDSRFPPSKPTTCSIYGHRRSPLGSVANFTRSSPDHPSLTRTEANESQQRPGHYQLGSNVEANMRRNPVDPLDYSFTQAHQRQNLHDIPQSHSSLGMTEPYQPPQRSCQCHLSPLQPQHFHQQASTYISSAGRPRTTHLTEPTVSGSTCRDRCLENPYTGNSSCSHQKTIYHQPECQDHHTFLCCNQPYQRQREFCHCIHCSKQKQHSQPFPGADYDYAGDFDSHHSELYNVSCSKLKDKNSKLPKTGFTSHLQQEEIASGCLHKQKSSKTHGVENNFSPPPSESIITGAKPRQVNYPAVPMIEIINRERLAENTTQNKQPDKPDEPQLSSSHFQSSCQPHTYPPQEIRDIFGVPNKAKKKKGGRGPTKCLELFDTEDKIHITTNEDGEPVGPDAPKLVSFLGMLARNGHVAPLTYVQWKALPEENKEKMWQLIQAKFDINPESKFWALKSLGRKWSAWKALLKVNHYNSHETNEARLADCNERVVPEQWRVLVEFWDSPEAKVISNINKANASHMKLCHAAGSKSFARVREEQRLKRPDGKEPSQADLFILTRTRKNGQPVTEASSRIISQLRDASQQQQGTSQRDTIENEVFVQVMGKDKSKNKRKHANRSGPVLSKTLPPEAEKIVSEAKTEVLEMKEKMVTVEQTCAQMAAQMATMMSMMQKKFVATNMPTLDASIEESEHVSASHNGF